MRFEYVGRAHDAEAKVRFVDWLADYMPIGTETMESLRRMGFVYLAEWCGQLNQQFAAMRNAEAADG